MNNIVYVISISGKPLMPCSIIKARHLLKSDKAKIVKYEPFTIQLLFECENQVQDITLGINSGYKNVGLSATTDKKELYSAEVKLRDDIVKLISSRRQLRRGRRFRNTRYRPARFDNRKKEDGWVAPSIKNKIEAHKKQVEKINQILPINKTIVEVSSFDIAKIKNSEIQGKEYQQGEQFGFENVRQYILWRDNHKCQSKAKCKDLKLVVHYIESRQTGGNAPNNLITLCKTCDESYHNGKLELKLKRGKSFRNVAFMNTTTRWKIYHQLKEQYPNVNLTYGYITKNIRLENKLRKEKRTDALCITGNPKVERVKEWWQLTQIRKKKRELHNANPTKKFKGRKRTNVKSITKKDKFWCLGDKVKLRDEVGFISGFSNNNVYVKDKDNKLLHLSTTKATNPNKLKLINRNNNWIESKNE